MITVTCKMRPVWSAPGRRGRLTKRAAYMNAAWGAYREAYGCGEDTEEAEDGTMHRHVCDHECFGVDPEVSSRVVDRLARWLMWRDGRKS